MLLVAPKLHISKIDLASRPHPDSSKSSTTIYATDIMLDLFISGETRGPGVKVRDIRVHKKQILDN